MSSRWLSLSSIDLQKTAPAARQRRLIKCFIMTVARIAKSLTHRSGAAQPRHADSAGDRLSQKVLHQTLNCLEQEPFDRSVYSSVPGERLSIQVGCLTQREAVRQRLEPKKATASRGKGARRKRIQYLYIEYWFHWKEQDPSGVWRCRSCYLGGHPKGQAPKGKLVARIDTIETQRYCNRPYGETLRLIGMADKMEQQSHSTCK